MVPRGGWLSVAHLICGLSCSKVLITLLLSKYPSHYIPTKGKIDFKHNRRIQHTGYRGIPSGGDDTLLAYPPEVGL